MAPSMNYGKWGSRSVGGSSLGPFPHPGDAGHAPVRVGQLSGYGSHGHGAGPARTPSSSRSVIFPASSMFMTAMHTSNSPRAPSLSMVDDRYLVDVVPVGVSRVFVVRLGRKDKGAPYGTDKLELIRRHLPPGAQDSLTAGTVGLRHPRCKRLTAGSSFAVFIHK